MEERGYKTLNQMTMDDFIAFSWKVGQIPYFQPWPQSSLFCTQNEEQACWIWVLISMSMMKFTILISGRLHIE